MVNSFALLAGKAVPLTPKQCGSEGDPQMGTSALLVCARVLRLAYFLVGGVWHQFGQVSLPFAQAAWKNKIFPIVLDSIQVKI